MTPEELEKLPKPLEHIMTALEESILIEIVERIRETAEITPTIDWLLQRLFAIGTSKAKIKKLIEEALKEIDKQVDEIYQQAIASDYIRNKEIYETVGKDYLPYSENQWLQQITDAIKEQTKDSLRPMENITQTTGFNISLGGGKKAFTPLSEYLERSLDKAMLGIVTGAKSYNQAISDVIDEMTASGVRVVDYASGKSDRIEVTARRAAMTGVAQLTDQVNEKNAAELGTDYWEVDWHMGARNTGIGYENHQSWQGKVYNSEEMRTVCGLGEMLGFAGINCYHIRFPFVPGASKRKYTDEWLEEQNRKENEKKTYRGKEYDTYSALQYQRRLERTMRKQKQDIMLLERAGADQEDIIAAKCRFQATSQTYTDFSRQMGLRQQRERLQIPKNFLPKMDSRKEDKTEKGQHEIFKRSPQERADMALDITERYTTRGSKWSGKVIVDDETCREERILGRKEWNCDIIISSKAGPKTYIHEMLHSRSGSYLNPLTYFRYSRMEEGSVEFLAREICRAEGIDFKEGYHAGVEALKRINAIAGIRKDDQSFAIALFVRELKDRYRWLEAEIKEYTEQFPDDMQELMNLLKCLKGMK